MDFVSHKGNIEIRGKQNALFPKDKSLSDLLYRKKKTKQNKTKTKTKANFEKRTENPATTSGLITCNSCQYFADSSELFSV